MAGRGEAGGESVGGGWVCACVCACASAVCLLINEFGRRPGWGCESVVEAGEAGGVWVKARGRVRALESSRGASAWLEECRCRLRKKLIPLWTPVGREEGEFVVMTVAATVWEAAGAAVVVNIPFPVSGTDEDIEPWAGGGRRAAV